MAAKTPLAFLSYAHSDDAHENGKLRIFAERLSGEVQLQWGAEFPIFIDRKDLKWGQQWKARIEESLARSGGVPPPVAPKAVVVSETTSQVETSSRAEPVTEKKPAPSEPHTVVVDAMRRGNTKATRSVSIVLLNDS